MAQTHYTLQCTYCGKEYEDSPAGFLLACPEQHPPSLLRARYQNKKFEIREELPGIFRFFNWLPVRTILKAAPGPAVFHSQKLGSLLGLENLLIAFSGYWPEKGALMETGTFKELEASPVCARIPENEKGVLVVSSAGNTARAFLHVCSDNAIPVVVVVPEVGLPSLWITRTRNSCVKIVTLKGDVDYFDAIRLGNIIAEQPGYFPEGGAKNVSRRDGLGTVLLSVVEFTGRLPAHYFQAVGSGTGGIAAWEMSCRLLADGRFGATKMRLHLSQNAPFTPMVDAWNQGSRTLLPMDEGEQKTRLRLTKAHVLSNRQPPYSVIGGVYDALRDSTGYMYAVSNAEAERAGAIFLKEEGCDLDPAAEVAVASLFQAVEQGRVGKKELVALNLTGGGYTILEREKRKLSLEPDVVITAEELQSGRIKVLAP